MNSYFVGSLLNLATLYMVSGVGVMICLKAGYMNLGGEGQIYLGGFITAVILANPIVERIPGVLAVSLAIVVAMSFSALLSFFSGFLLYTKHADMLFTSFIISAAVIPLIDGLVSGPFRGVDGNLLATPFIKTQFRLRSFLPPSAFNISFIFAILLCINYWYSFNRTSKGRKLTIYGVSDRFAIYAGYNSKSIIYTVTAASGAMQGLCGALAVIGTYYTCHVGFYSSLGWNAFSAALIAAGNPLLLIPAAGIMATLIHSSVTYSMFHNFGFDMSSIIQAVILFMIATYNYDRRKKHA